MTSGRDLRAIPADASDSRREPVEPPVGARGVVGLVLLVLVAVAGMAVVFVAAGCTPAELADAKGASTLCQVVERAAGGAVLQWEGEREAPIVAGAEAARGLPELDKFKSELAAQRAELKKATACLDSLDFACNALASSVKIAADTKSAIPGDVVTAVLSSVAKLVRVLVDLGVKLPPLVQQLAAGVVS